METRCVVSLPVDGEVDPAGGHVTELRLPEGIAVQVRVARPCDDGSAIGLLGVAERRRRERFRRAIDRDRYVVGRRLLRHAVAAARGGPPEAVEVRAVPAPGLAGAGDGGRPVVAGGPRGISIAHGGDLVLIAVCERHLVGIDVEPAGSAARIEAVESALLGPSERAALETAVAGSGRARERALLRAWTRKEALLKAVGVGLTVSPTALVVADDGGPRVTASAADLPAPERFLLRDLDVGPDHVAALALVRADAPAGKPVRRVSR